MMHPWPEDESRDAAFGGVFDEAMKPPKTGQDIVDELLICLAVSRAHELALPPGVLTAAERIEKGLAMKIVLSSAATRHGPPPEWASASLSRAQATQTLLRGESSCTRRWLQAWLLERRPLKDFVEHWRTCGRCQSAVRGPGPSSS